MLPSSTTTISCGTSCSAQFEVQVLDGRRDAAVLVARGDDDRQLAERRQRGIGSVLGRSCARRSPVGRRASRGAAWRARGFPRACPPWCGGAPSASGRARARRRARSRGCRTGASVRRRLHGMIAEALAHQALSWPAIAPTRAAAHVDDPRTVAVARCDLPLDERHQIGGMQAVAHLVAAVRRIRCSGAAGAGASC